MGNGAGVRAGMGWTLGLGLGSEMETGISVPSSQAVTAGTPQRHFGIILGGFLSGMGMGIGEFGNVPLVAAPLATAWWSLTAGHCPTDGQHRGPTHQGGRGVPGAHGAAGARPLRQNQGWQRLRGLVLARSVGLGGIWGVLEGF